MYGWDSYFIIRGLLREGKFDLARGMVENFFFEIEHYGAVLNANRTYYLTRSQPPFLSSMIMAVYEADKPRGQASRAWVEKAYHYAERDYQMWTSDPHLAGSTGLSRFYDFGEGPVPEGLHDEVDYYHDVLAYFLRENRQSPYLVEADSAEKLPHPEYSQRICDDEDSSAEDSKCDRPRYVSLSSEYYKGDRSMRESGFDISFRFGPYGADTDHYAPVCLNSLLYKTEMDLEKMSLLLGNKKQAIQWRKRAGERRKVVQALLWDRQRGLFFDYQFREKKLSSYVYATTFYPLWVGIATDEQARAVAHNLPLLENQGGLAMSTQNTGVQWDYPYGWAPIQLLAVEGLRRYGYNADANRISYKFLSMVLANFERDKDLREKYDVVMDSSNIQVAEGYRGNIIGFGWTNAVFLELMNQMPRKWVARIGERPEPNPPK
jgi:alpha,alpha-trehalase